MKEVERTVGEEKITVCNICGNELRQAQNDWDSFFVCDWCDLDNFTDSKLKPLDAIKRTTYLVEID